jgi:hypothetical protein
MILTRWNSWIHKPLSSKILQLWHHVFWYHLDFPIVIHVLKIEPSIKKLELNYLNNIGQKTWLNIKKIIKEKQIKK